MSYILTISLSALLFILGALYPKTSMQQSPQNTATKQSQPALKGAWKLTSGTTQFVDIPEGATAVTMMEDGYFTVTYYNPTARKFIGTFGGTYTTADGKLTQNFEYNTLDSTKVGTSNALTYTLKDGKLQVKAKGLQQTWASINPENTAPLDGTWRITGRAGDDGTISPMQRGPRKTLKILSDGRFQWIAFNTETRQFSGTGGGTYTAENGKYIENIDFFSRDSSRVGASLSFNYEVKDGKWLHSGKSSTGKDISEVWEREQQGI